MSVGPDPDHVESVTRRALCAQPRCGRAVVVAVDGPSGAGKTGGGPGTGTAIAGAIRSSWGGHPGSSSRAAAAQPARQVSARRCGSGWMLRLACADAAGSTGTGRPTPPIGSGGPLRSRRSSTGTGPAIGLIWCWTLADQTTGE